MPQRATDRRSLGMLHLLGLLLALAPLASAEGLSRVVEYRSPIDDSLQAYGVYVPSVPPPSERGYPAVLHGHGYGWSVSTSFSEFQRSWADEHGWVLIHLNARGPNFYEGVGDIETLNVVADAAARFGLDRDRIYMTGGSMGGTGALRHGLRHPDVFAAVMGVDGWTDFREWHHHWYARSDDRDLIEEFRRPLLEAASPLYWAERGKWGATGHIVDGGDTVVLPENGLRLRERLVELAAAEPGAYDFSLIFNPTLGHGGGTDYAAIYGFFLGRTRVLDPVGFQVQTPILPHGELYWGRIEGFLIDGISGSLEAHARGDAVTVTTDNLAGFTLYLAASPAAEAQTVRVYADGFPCYQGPAQTITCEAEVNAAGTVVGWRPASPPPALSKRPGLSGPIGDAFVRPFVVAYATAGDAGALARHRLEAEQFAQQWDEFMVHGEAVAAIPEQAIDPADLATHTVVLFGSLDTSALLRRADAVHELPVRILEGGVIVRDPVQGERRYMGEQFGALMCYPNPLTGFGTYLVVANRRVCTQPDGGAPQMLGYDLEKLPWAYPDYVVFNTDQAELPFVLNVNNKPPVTCYEAAYFVEAGFFDRYWAIDRGLQLRRVRAQQPQPHRLVHLSELAFDPGPPPLARVRITDSGGQPVRTARVTGRWWGEGESVASASTDEDGRAAFAAPPAADLERSSFEVVNVMATGCTYDWSGDVPRCLALGARSPRQLDVVPLTDHPAVAPEDALSLRFAVCNNSVLQREVAVRLMAPSGRVLPEEQTLQAPAHGRVEVGFTWRPELREPGPAELRVEATTRGDGMVASALLPITVQVLPSRGLPIVLTAVKGSDIEWGQPWRVTATVRSYGGDPVSATLHCALMQAGVFPASKRVLLPARGSATVEWTGAERLEKGEYRVRVSVEEAFGVTDTAHFAVR
ncbi:MAG: prolyl oligopeptidase family serine peptidase [Armatimonadota bacterium]